MNTIFPATCFGSNVPSSTSAAEISLDGSESFCGEVEHHRRLRLGGHEPIAADDAIGSARSAEPARSASFITAANDNAGTNVPCGVSKTSGMARDHAVGGVLVHLHVADPRGDASSNGWYDVRAFERERRLPVLRRARLRDAFAEDHVAGALDRVGKRLVVGGVVRFVENTTSNTMTAAPASARRSVSSAMRQRGHGSGSWNWLMDSRSIPTTTTRSSVGAPGKKRIGRRR